MKTILVTIITSVLRSVAAARAAVFAALLIGASTANLHAATFSDHNWTSMGGYPGANGPVNATAVDGSGNLYIGGGFNVVGDLPANCIAKWNGTNWSALGSGLQGTNGWAVVSALALSGNDLYAAGRFTTAGDVAANSIAKWNGTNWSALGSGIGGDNASVAYVYALAVSGSDVYAAGDFTMAGGNAANRIAKWNGSSWSALGSGMNYTVTALAVSGSDLYAGGGFTNAGGITASGIAKWNGNSWSALGSGTSQSVTALAVSGSDLYVAGNGRTNVAKWDGSSWSLLSSLVGSGIGRPNTLTVSGGDLYAGGNLLTYLTSNSFTYRAYVAKWTGGSWLELGSGITYEWGEGWDESVDALAVSGTNVYAGGAFRRAGEVTAYCIAKWNGSNWSALGSTYQLLTAVTASGRDVYGAGSFAAADGTQSNYVAKWNTTNWSALGTGFQSDNSFGSVVSALAVSGNDLYVGGSFTNAGGTPANRIAKWDGTHWSALGSGIGWTNYNIPTVDALVVSGNDLYAGGQFSSAGGIAANNIAKWNGTNWSALGSGIGPWGTVSALALLGSNLYAGGIFIAAGGSPANYIAKWDGSSWSALGSGMGGSGSAPGYVTALAVLGNDLYAGGFFTTAGGVTVRCVAKWNGSNWSPLCSGMAADGWTPGGEHNTTPYVYALAVSGSDLYVGGEFNEAGGIAANYIAKWNGSSWTPVGSGMNYGVRLLAASDTDLFAAGSFTRAGGKISPYVAQARIGSTAQAVTTANSTASIRFSGVTGYDYDVQHATNLSPPITWTTVNTNTLSPLPDGSFTLTDTNAVPDASYYRAVLRPMPVSEIGVQQPVGTALIHGVSSVAFGAVAVGSSATKSFTITNGGTAALTIFYIEAEPVRTPIGNGVFLLSDDFVVDTTGIRTSLPAGGSTTFTVTFSPTATGSRTSAIYIQTDAVVDGCESNEGTFVIFLTGTGL